MSITEFIERLSETIIMEMEDVLHCNIKYNDDVPEEIVVLLGNGVRLTVSVKECGNEWPAGKS